MNDYLASKYLQARQQEDKYVIRNLVNGKRIAGNVDLVQYFQKPYKEEGISDKLYENQFLTFIQGDRQTEERILFQWSEKFGKKVTCYENNLGKVLYGSNENENLNKMLNKIIEIYKEVKKINCKNPYHRDSIKVCFFNEQEFKQMVEELHIAQGALSLIYAKSVLFLNSDLCNEEWTLYPIVKHELLHLHLSDIRCNLPFWLEEGLCELYSFGRKTEDINRRLIGEKLTNFYQFDEKYRYDYEQFINDGLCNNLFYMQAQSFAGFLLCEIGEKEFWDMLNKIDISLEFGRELKDNLGLDFEFLSKKWIEYIRHLTKG